MDFLILERLKAVCQLAANFSLQPLADRGRRGLAADHLRDERGEVVGRRRGEAEELVGVLGHRVLEPQLVRVQHRARRALGLETVPVGVAVDGIAEQRVAQVLHVHAHLVRAPRANQHRHHGAPPVVTWVRVSDRDRDRVRVRVRFRVRVSVRVRVPS